VAEDERKLRVRKLAVDDVQVGSTDGSGMDTNEQSAGARFRFQQLR